MTGIGRSRPRPLLAASASTAAGWNASAASPYEASTGMTTSSPRRIESTAVSSPSARSTGSAQSKTSDKASPLIVGGCGRCPGGVRGTPQNDSMDSEVVARGGRSAPAAR